MKQLDDGSKFQFPRVNSEQEAVGLIIANRKQVREWSNGLSKAVSLSVVYIPVDDFFSMYVWYWLFRFRQLLKLRQ